MNGAQSSSSTSSTSTSGQAANRSVKCDCIGQCKTKRCSCVKAGLSCMDDCNCRMANPRKPRPQDVGPCVNPFNEAPPSTSSQDPSTPYWLRNRVVRRLEVLERNVQDVNQRVGQQDDRITTLANGQTQLVEIARLTTANITQIQQMNSRQEERIDAQNQALQTIGQVLVTWCQNNQGPARGLSRP